MRLGQLARKLALRPAAIVEFLSQNNILIDEGTNTRLDDDHVGLVMSHFAPDYKEEVVKDEEALVQAEEPQLPKSVIEITPDIETTVALDNDNIETPIPANQTIEVIKAPKVELSGLKVLGKIELPETKKKEIKPISDESTIKNIDSSEEEKPVKENRRTPHIKKERESREVKPRKNPIALQREREALEEEQRKQVQAKLEKEKRTEYYLRKVKSSVPTKPVKLIEEPVEEMSASDLREPPKTLLGKFLRWFTT